MPSVVIGVYDEALENPGGRTVVAVDVLRATTTAVTAVALGRRCLPVASLEAATKLANELDGAMLAGELGGNMPYGFELMNSPAAVAERDDVDRPLILLSSSGTRLLCDAAAAAPNFYVASLRNVSASAAAVSAAGDDVAVIGAATRGEFREEDQLCCAWITALLGDAGFDLGDGETAELVQRWRGRPVEDIGESNSVRYLRDTHQLRDFEFVLAHVDDLPMAFGMRNGEVVRA